MPEITHRPTSHFKQHTSKPTTFTNVPTPSPTINYWASNQGRAYATSTLVGLVALFMALCGWTTRRRKRLEGADLGPPGAGQSLHRDVSAADSTPHNPLFSSLLDDDDGDRPIVRLGSTASTAPVPPQPVSSLLHDPSTPWRTFLLFWLFMLTRTGLVVFGLVSYWDRVNLIGTVVQVHGDDQVNADDALVDDTALVADFDVEVYIATFWINVKQFWNSDAKAMACLIFFAGVIQPIIQMASASVIAFSHLTRSGRNRMITMQEMTCKVPLSAFYVEAYLLIVFCYDLSKTQEVIIPVPTIDYDQTFEASGSVVIRSFIGLVLFLFGQLLFLAIVNLLRLEHRRLAALEDNERLIEHPTDRSLNRPSVPSSAASSVATLVQEIGYGPSRDRPWSRRILVFSVAVGLVAATYLSCTWRFISFQYTGVIAPYISVKDGSHEKGILTVSLNLWEVTTQLKDDLIPAGFAWLYSVCAVLILIVDPLLLATAAIIDVCLSNSNIAARRMVGEVIELLQCWSGGEAILVASIFLVPNIELITKFVFDASDQCAEVDTKVGQDCFLVSGKMETHGTIALCAYAALAILLSRLCVSELHGHYGNKEKKQSFDATWL